MVAGPSEVLRFVECAVTAHIPLHPLEEVDHDALQQQATQHSQQGESAVGVQSHSDCLEIRCQDKYFNEPEAQRCVVMFPDDSWD